MSCKVRTEVKVKGYHFPSVPGLVFHSGKFWFNEMEVKRVVNNGSLALLIGQTKMGLRKLRRDAQPCEVQLIDMPF